MAREDFKLCGNPQTRFFRGIVFAYSLQPRVFCMHRRQTALTPYCADSISGALQLLVAFIATSKESKQIVFRVADGGEE
jgi:hypothetical protein